MKYQSKSSIAYMFRNFWRLAPIGLPAAVLLGLFFNTETEIELIRQLSAGEVTSQNLLQTLLNSVTVMRFGQYWWVAVITLFVFAFTESLLIRKVERHMRVGEMPVFPLRSAFVIFPTVLFFILCVTVVVEALNLTVVGIAFLIRRFSPVAVCAISVVALYLGRILATLLTGALLFAFPIMILENYSFNNALSYSVRLMNERLRYLWFFALVYPALRLILSVICYFVNVHVFTVCVFAAFYLLALMILPCIIFKLYYETVGGDRRDLKVLMFKK